jgi:ADP-heptose:LPS heptosyltransferase
MKIGAYKSGGFGDMADYIVLLNSVRVKHPGADLRVYARLSSPAVGSPYLRLLSACGFEHVEILPDETHPFLALTFLYQFARQFDLFYNFRPYVGRMVRGDTEAILNLPSRFVPPDHWSWEWKYRQFYENPLSQYQNILTDHYPGKSHLEITADSCELPPPDWDSVEIDLPDSKIDSGFITVSVSAAGSDKGIQQTKCWSIKNWQSVVDSLSGYPVIQVGVGSEPRLRGVQYFWNQDILDLLALLKSSRLHLAIENGTVRLRRLVTDSPSIVLFGSTHPEFFGLPGNVAIHSNCCRPCFWLTGEWMTECYRADSRGISKELLSIFNGSLPQRGEFDRICMRSITPEMVLREVKCLISAW